MNRLQWLVKNHSNINEQNILNFQLVLQVI